MLKVISGSPEDTQPNSLPDITLSVSRLKNAKADTLSTDY